MGERKGTLGGGVRGGSDGRTGDIPCRVEGANV